MFLLTKKRKRKRQNPQFVEVALPEADGGKETDHSLVCDLCSHEYDCSGPKKCPFVWRASMRATRVRRVQAQLLQS
jgi:hypothetical protein